MGHPEIGTPGMEFRIMASETQIKGTVQDTARAARGEARSAAPTAALTPEMQALRVAALELAAT